MGATYKRIFFSLLIYICLIICFKYFNSYVPIIIIISIIYCIANKLYEVFHSFKLSNSKFITFTSLIIINFVVFSFIYGISRLFLNKLYLIQDGIIYLSNIYQNISYELLGRFNINDILENVFQNFINNLQYRVLITKGLSITMNTILSYFMANIIVYFLITDKIRITNCLRKFFCDKIINNINSRVTMLKEIIKIDFKTMFICTIINIIGFLILRIKYGFLLGILCGVFDIMPLIGTFLIFIPLIIYGICVKNYIVTVGLIILFFLISAVRKIIETRYLKNSFDIHPLIVLLSIYISVNILGVTGVLVGSMYAITLKEIWEG